MLQSSKYDENLISPSQISIVIATHNRPASLAKTLSSLNFDSGIQVHVVMDQVLEKASLDVLQRHPKAQYSHFTGTRNYGDPRNQGVAQTDRPWILFLDDDAYLPPAYFQELLQASQRYPKASILGGPNLTPPQSSFFAHISGQCLASFWGTGPSHARYQKKGVIRPTNEQELILCNLIVKRALFEKIHFEKVQGGEENLLMSAASKIQEELVYSPELYVYHERRDHLVDFIQQIFRYGRGRGLNFKKGNFHWFHTLPFLFLGSILFFVWHQSVYVNWLFLFYFSLNFIFSLQVSWQQKSFRSWPLSFLLFPTIHFFYFLGLIKGLFSRNP